MNVTPLQPSVSQAEQATRAQLDPMQDGVMLQRVKGDANVVTEEAAEKNNPSRAAHPDLGNKVDTYA